MFDLSVVFLIPTSSFDSIDQVLLGLVVVQKLGSDVMSKACALMKKMGSENYTLFDDNGR